MPENQPLTEKVSKPRKRAVLYVDLTGRRAWVVEALRFLASKETVKPSLATVTFNILASHFLLKYGPAFVLQFQPKDKKFTMKQLQRLLRS